jgi:transcription initiation factor IIE alpha subunit
MPVHPARRAASGSPVVTDSVEAVKFPTLEWSPARTIQDQILDCLKQHKVVTLKMFRAELTGATESIARELYAMVEAGTIECGKAKDPVTGRIVKAFRIKS